MTWQDLLSEDDLRLYEENIDLLIDQIRLRFNDSTNNPLILDAMRRVPRHLFVDRTRRALAYTDRALPTSEGMTTSAPSIVAEMIALAMVRRGERILEVGTGTGYEAAVLAELGARVHSIEIVPFLAETANRILVALGYKYDKTADGPRGTESLQRYHSISRSYPQRGVIDLYEGSGLGGLPSFSPFRAIIVAAAATDVESLEELTEQLSPDGGRLIVPIGDRHEQILHVIERTGERTATTPFEDHLVTFVPLIEA